MSDIDHETHAERIDISIQLLKQYVNDDRIKSLFPILEALKDDENNKPLLTELTEMLDSFGILQGAILTCAPYICFLVSHDLFEDD